jgi:ABC-type Fe3+ transport system permease subunit
MTVTAALLAVALASGVTALAAWMDRRREVQHRRKLEDSLVMLERLVLGQDSGA